MSIKNIEKMMKELKIVIAKQESKGMTNTWERGMRLGIRSAIWEMVEEVQKHEQGSEGNRHVYIPNLDWLSLKEKLLKISEGK
jgi:hypothetical protein